jgi:hypothetical protein
MWSVWARPFASRPQQHGPRQWHFDEKPRQILDRARERGADARYHGKWFGLGVRVGGQ